MSISPNELRRGNWITNGIEPFQVTEISDGSLNLEYSEGGGHNWIYDMEDCSGIPLSPEILEKIGMKRRFDNDTCNIWDMEAPVPTRNKVLCLALIKDGWIYPSSPGAIPFHHVHQLQNLYYALTGQELSINL